MALNWIAQGPRPTVRGQVEGILDKEVVGAIKALAPHPVDAHVLYVGAVNGGVWRSDDAAAPRPTWRQLTDAGQTLSIGALRFDPTDASHRTLVAGIGRFSSYGRSGGALLGVLRTVDAGATWTLLDGGGTLRGLHFCDVAPRGQTILAAANNGGVYRSTDTGATWARITGAAGTGLPAGVSFALAGDPVDPQRLFAHVGTRGIFGSADTGATWAKLSDPAIDGMLGAGATNVKIAVGMNRNVYVAIAVSGVLAALFRSGTAGAAWTSLDVPMTTEAGGVQFGAHPGRQADIHLSLAADRENHDVVYVGGDRQPSSDEALASAKPWPNSIGARDYSGRLFRVDASRPPGAQAAPLTHSHTASNSAPHADSRDLALDAGGDLLEADDGGVYRRTAPRTASGDWLSLNGDLQVTELHSAAWDDVSSVIIGGAQDTGVPQQEVPGAARWPSVSTGDGGCVAIDDSTTVGFSTRYSSAQRLWGLRREVFDAAGAFHGGTWVALAARAGSLPPRGQFYTPMELNQVTATRLVLAAANGVYESDDQGDTVTAIAPGIAATALAYGATGNADMLYVGSGARVFVRSAAHPASLAASATYPGTQPIVGIAVPPDDPQTAFVVDASAVYHTTNAGASWRDITGNLMALGAVVLRSVAYCEHLGGGAVLVGTNAGVFQASAPAFGWTALGSDLPRAPVLRLRYGRARRTVLAATLGRGAWTLSIP